MLSRPKYYFWTIFVCISISILFFESIDTYSSRAALGPLIYTPDNSVTFYVGSPPIIPWYIISNNPDIYWITLGVVKNATNVVDEGLIYNGTVLTSVIKFRPILPVGSYVLTLYVKDYSYKTGNSSVFLTIVPTTFPASTTGNIPSAATPFPLFYSLLTLVIISSIMIKFRHKLRNKKD